MTDQGGAEAWSFDPMGRTVIDKRTTNSVAKSTTIVYNLDGSLAQITYPSGNAVAYNPNNAAQPVSAVDSAHSINYATMALYDAAGDLRSLVNGNGTGILSTLYFNNRLQICRIAVNSSGTAPGTCGDGTNHGNALDYSFNFNLGTSNNGNVMAITNNLTKNSSTDRSQIFTYDALNRIATAGTVSTSGANCWGEKYGYDTWGNLLSITGNTSQYTGCSQESGFTVTVPNSNQIAGFCYDTAGNLLAQSAPPCSSPAYTFNAENQLTSTAGVTYTYDGDGKRVEKSNGKLYWYGTNPDALDETDASGNLTDEYIFFGGKRIARRDSSGNVDYYLADHLGTVRVVTNATGAVPVLDDSDFYPFGGQRVVLSSSGNTYKFTGKERDTESGLDNFGARYDSSQYGRFMSPDPDGKSGLDHPDDPQSFNGYSYARNNPLLFTDPDGRDYTVCQVDRDQKVYNCGVVTDDTAFEDYAKGQGWTIQGGYLVDQSGQTVGSASWSGGPDWFAAAVQGTQMATPGVNLAANGLMLFGNVIAPGMMTAAQCLAGGCSAGDVALAMLPEIAALREGATILREGRAVGKGAEILEKGGGVAKATEDYNGLNGAEKIYGDTKVKTMSDGSKAVLHTSSSGGEPTLAIQDSAGRTTTKYRY